MNKLIYTAIAFCFIIGCTDPIPVDVDFEEPKLVVDAWLNDAERPQTVRLTWSQNYFNSNPSQGILGADVSITSSTGEVFDFVDSGTGDYTWIPGAGESLGDVGDEFTLNIDVDNTSYQSMARMNRVPPIDSITQEFREKEVGFAEGIYAQLYVTDFDGRNDSYWARCWKNDTLLNKPQEMIIVYDATFDPGNSLDGVAWIPPLREAINPLADSDEDEDGFQVVYEPGDRIYCEVFSISNDAFRFLQIAQEQMSNGDNSIFALPIANTDSNVINLSTGEPVLGFFNVGAMSSANKIIE